jgi:ubiquinone/menaquinone biosynthesis C-methylase UbiE
MKLKNLLLASVLFLTSLALYGQSGQTEGINDPYIAPNLQVSEWVERFEGEGREAFDLRHEIVAAIDIEEGQVVADVGAGTGLFVPLLANAVGPQGRVYAIDIAPRFIRHIADKSKKAGLRQVKAVLSTERSIEMPTSSLDLIFTCDAYHHFIHYEEMLASMHAALKPGGQLIVVDFDIGAEGTRDWTIEHVGGTKQEFSRQIEAAGFKFVEDLTLDRMKANFMYRYVKE